MSALRNESGVDPGRRGGERRGRRRPPWRPVEVVSVSTLKPRLVSVRLGGPGLEVFQDAAPTSHIKAYLPRLDQAELLLPEIGPDGAVLPADASASVVRTYTPRSFDRATGELEVQFVLHGDGPASEWAAPAKPGDGLAIRGPGGRFSFDPSPTCWWVAGDESAIPAIGTLLDAMPTTANAEVHIEVDGADDEIDFESKASLKVFWHHRQPAYEPGAELNHAVTAADMGTDTRAWVACEATAVRLIRRHLLEDRRLPADSIVTRGYWRLGSVNHPDHDYGEDS
jgi:NADPH-dependent ferric siderophore reductase